MSTDFQYSTDFYGMNSRELSHTCMHLLCLAGEASFVFNEHCTRKLKNNKIMDFRMQDRMELKALVDFYATESDKNNQDCYVEIFRPDIKLNVYFGGKLGMTANDVQDMIRQYKAFGAAKVSFHMNGQQSVDFIDETHATGTCYALATLVTEQDGKDVLTTHAVRYYDKYEKIDGRWWISEREQHFEWSTNQTLG